MKITVNGEQRQVQERTLADLCASLGYGDARIATALNGAFVPAARRAETLLHDDDRVEIVAGRGSRDKVGEELRELDEAVQSGNKDRIEDELVAADVALVGPAFIGTYLAAFAPAAPERLDLPLMVLAQAFAAAVREQADHHLEPLDERLVEELRLVDADDLDARLAAARAAFWLSFRLFSLGEPARASG